MGGFVGRINTSKDSANNSHIKNSTSSPTINANGFNAVGGFIGRQVHNYDGKAIDIFIESSRYDNTAIESILCTDCTHLGGFIGYLKVGALLKGDEMTAGTYKISDSFSNANIKAVVDNDNDPFATNIGGFVGKWDDGGQLDKNYSAGSIELNTTAFPSTSLWNIGGLVGYITDNDSDPTLIAEVSNSYSTVGIKTTQTANNLRVGGLVGTARIKNTNGGVFNSVYYYTSVFEIDGKDCTNAIGANCEVPGMPGPSVNPAGVYAGSVAVISDGDDTDGMFTNNLDLDDVYDNLGFKATEPATSASTPPPQNMMGEDDWSLGSLSTVVGTWSGDIWESNDSSLPPTFK